VPTGEEKTHSTIYARRQLQSLVRSAAHSGPTLQAFGDGIGSSIRQVEHSSNGGPNSLQKAEQRRPTVRLWSRV